MSGEKLDQCKISSRVRENLINMDKKSDKEKFSKSMLKQFVEIAATLSNFLPKVTDSSLFEIDDLIYPDDDLNKADMSGVRSEDVNASLDYLCCKSYFRLHLIAIQSYPPNRILDATYLQVIKSLPREDLRFPISIVTTCSEFCFETREKTKVCIALKLFKVGLESHREEIIKWLQNWDTHTYLYLWLLNFPQIPEGRHPQQKRCSSWIKKQSEAIIRMIGKNSLEFPEELKEYLDKNNSLPKQFDVMHANRFQDIYANSMSVHTDHLHEFFMSAKNEEERIQRLKDFLVGISLPSQKYGEGLLFYEVPTTKSTMESCSDFVKILSHSAVTILLKQGYPDEVLRDMERRYGSQVEPYLSSDKSNDYNFVAELEFKDEIIDSSTNYEDEPDYTIERFLFYDDFVKKLQVVNIIHTASMMCQELIQSEGDVIDYDNVTFREVDSHLKRFFLRALQCPTKRGYIPWVIEILLKKCPFMIIPKRRANLMSDLIKMLKGEDIEEIAEEKLILTFYSMQIDDYCDYVDFME